MTVGGVLKVGLGLGIVILVLRRCAQGTAEDTVPSPRPTPKPPSRPRSSERRSDSSPSKGFSKMRDAIVAKAIALGIPDPDLQRDYVGEPESRWIDTVLGGQKAPGVWRWFEKGHGTTCMIFATAVLEQAGAPKEFLNRPWPGEAQDGQPTAHYKLGGWMAPMQTAGAKPGAPASYERNPSTIEPGDVYVLERDLAPGARSRDRQESRWDRARGHPTGGRVDRVQERGRRSDRSAGQAMRAPRHAPTPRNARHERALGGHARRSPPFP